MWWAPFSPIMIDGACVLPLMSVGMIDASMTRSPSMPVDPQLRVDDRHVVAAHLAGPDRVVVGLGPLP